MVLLQSRQQFTCWDTTQETKFNEGNTQSLLHTLKKCTDSKDLQRGRKLHVELISTGQNNNIQLANKVLDMYVKCGSMVDARKVFYTMPYHTVVSWNTLMMGYVENGQGNHALQLYSALVNDNYLKPDSWSFVAAVKACTLLATKETCQKLGENLLKMDSLELGMLVHSEAVKYRCGTSIYVTNVLIDMYAKCGSIHLACVVFHGAPYTNLVSWNSMVMGYADNGEEESALNLLEVILNEGLLPNRRTYIAALKACSGLATKNETARLRCLEICMLVHSRAVGDQCDDNLYVIGSLIDTYGKCRSLVDARYVFEKRRHRLDVVAWNAMMLGYVENGEAGVALELFLCMEQGRTVSPDWTSYTIALMACTSLASLEDGKAVHAGTCRKGFDLDKFVVSSLVELYGKCGSVAAAELVFGSSPVRDSVMWRSLLLGYGRNGDPQRVFVLFHEMEEQGLRPGSFEFSVILSACSRAGLVERGKEYFKKMVEYGIEAGIEHYHSMMDMLGKANRVDEAFTVLESMPFQPDEITWKTVLSACSTAKDLEGGRRAFESFLKLNTNHSAAYALMANIYEQT